MTYMTAWTHGGFAVWTRYPVIGSLISVVVTFVQQVASFSAKDKHRAT